MACDGFTLEVTRVATDGCPNACSALYGAAWKVARAMGYRRLITYTLPEEGGSSLRGAGWTEDGSVKGMEWRGRWKQGWQGLGERTNDWPTSDKTRWVKMTEAFEGEVRWPELKEDDGDDVFDLFGEGSEPELGEG
jgi:hypothetical protein